MSNFILGYADVGLNCAFTSSDSWDTNLPLTMLNNEFIKAIAKTNADASIVIDITIDAADVGDIEVMGIVNSNLNTGTYQWDCYSEAGRTTNVYSSGSISIPTFYDKLNYKTVVDVADAPYDQRYWRLTINETTESYISIGRIFMGKRFNPDKDMDYGMQMGVSDLNSRITKSVNGIETYSKEMKQRYCNFALSLMDTDSGDSYFKMNIEAGLTGAVLFEYDPTNFKGGLYSYLGKLSNLNPLDFPFYNINGYKVNLEELL